jgi:hypothetical protein
MTSKKCSMFFPIIQGKFAFEFILLKLFPPLTLAIKIFHSIDDDILKLMDEVDIDEFLREAATAIDDPDALIRFIREKSTIAIERFLVRWTTRSMFLWCRSPL